MKRGLPIDDLIRRFFGDIERWPVEPDGLNLTQGQIKAVCQYIHKTGACLWHAEAVVCNWANCHCVDCNGGPTKREVRA